MASIKKERWTEGDVRCPFYLADSDKPMSISCEGAVQCMRTSILFKSFEEKDRQMGRYCVGRYEKCPQYIAVYATKYADEL